MGVTKGDARSLDYTIYIYIYIHICLSVYGLG